MTIIPTVIIKQTRLIILAYTVVIDNKNTIEKIPINHKQNKFFILAILKLVQKQFVQYLIDK